MDHLYTNKKIAVLAAGSAQGETGGAERFYQGLVKAFLEKGCDARLVNIPADESSFDSIRENYARTQALDLSAYDLVISTKSPTFSANHSNHLLYLVHTTRVFYDMFDVAFPGANDTRRQQRQAIQSLDTSAIQKIKHRFSIGYEVSERLRKWNGIDSEVLHPPIGISGLYGGEAGDYFFLPGRLHPWKRVDLVIRAVKASTLPLKLLIAGTGEAETDLWELADGDTRIEFLGRVSDKDLIKLYAGALAVPFVPLREDYGYVTLEAFASGKPVITCHDSGEPLQFVHHNQTGLVCDPRPESVCAALECLFKNRLLARELGNRGLQSIAHITWSNVVERLLKNGFSSETIPKCAPTVIKENTKVAILDMQPIEPTVGGGRLRLFGLYHALGDTLEARYVGTYDWPGERYRQHQLTPGLEEIDVPLSEAHHAAANQLAQRAGGKTVIDIAFPRQCHLSPEYLAKVHEVIEWADIVIFSHPWVFPLVEKHLKTSQLVVYDSQNVEGFLRAQLLDPNNTVETQLLREVVQAEYKLGCRANLILACSHEDLDLFARIYDWPADKMRIIPNAVMASKISPPSINSRIHAKQSVGLAIDRMAAIFIGSAYAPNVEAAKFIIQNLAPQLPNCNFVIAGGVGAGNSEILPKNVTVTGFIDDQQKLAWLQACDLAVNPMFSGSGTNIKMFDFMAAGLPIISTAIGARGISTAGRQPVLIVDNNSDAFASGIRTFIDNPAELQQRSIEARGCIEDEYSWERISPQLGRLLRLWKNGLGHEPPYFTIIIPTYDRHDQLDALVVCLKSQIERNFEVVMVDQSPVPWVGRDEDFGFPLNYVHTNVKGAVRARNTGALYARGTILAFTDDDCRPVPTWLSSARPYFKDSVVGAVEGLIESDHLHDPNFRPVTNVGFEGIGFMTANLIVRSALFHRVGGFDLNFDKPHFREDTDFGWRIQELGLIPYSNAVKVFHPAQPRITERESSIERARFFEKDALLYKKHPENYMRLFLIEGHWSNTKGFWENFERGALKYGVDISTLLHYKYKRARQAVETI